MDLDPPQPRETPLTFCSGAPPKGTTLSRNDRKWEAHRSEIHQLYMACNNTLPETMRIIEENRGFKASTRKWKTKLKEWGYEKYLTEADKRMIVSKAEKRRREGKETVFYHGDSQIMATRIENFKRRKTTKDHDIKLLTAETPAYITYSTPRYDFEESVSNNPVSEMTNQVRDLAVIQEETSQDLPGTSVSQAPLPDDDCVDFLVSDQDQNSLLKEAPTAELITNNNIAEENEKIASPCLVRSDIYSAKSRFEKAFESWAQLNDEASTETLQVLSHLAQVYETRNLSELPIPIHRIVVSGFRIALGDTTLQWSPHDTESLAQVLVNAGEFEEAVLWYKAAIHGYQKLKLLHNTLECRYSLAQLLRHHGRDKEAIECIIPALVGHLRNDAEFHGTAKVIIILRELYMKTDYGGLWNHVTSELTAIQTQLEKPGYKFDLTSESDETFNFFYLADAYSLMLKFNTAESILSCLLPRIEDNSYIKAVYEYYYARNRARLGHYVESASRLLSSHAILMKIGRKNGSLTERVKRRLVEVLPEIKELSKLALMQSGFEQVLLPSPDPAFQIIRTGYLTGLSTSPSHNIIILQELKRQIQDLCV